MDEGEDRGIRIPWDGVSGLDGGYELGKIAQELIDGTAPGLTVTFYPSRRAYWHMRISRFLPKRWRYQPPPAVAYSTRSVPAGEVARLKVDYDVPDGKRDGGVEP